MKEVGKIYSAVNADELEAGDIVLVGNEVDNVRGNNGVTLELTGFTSSHYFRVSNENPDYFEFAKLICPKRHAEVYKAWKSGAKVEVLGINTETGEKKWLDLPNPLWLEDQEIRVAEQKPTYRPFKNLDELVETWASMMGYKAKPNTMPLIWVKLGKAEINEITGFSYTNNVVCLRGTWYSLKDMFEGCRFLDGTPFGVREE